ncbi:MAG: SDR family oxidoreductase [Rhodospirillaceae bacterium]|nr:SDR family oxidoreductase [Rhodospirillaceae bacterium]MBT5191382.1 SDR family oxidoreductase [Rhodospirillaceae bacterium]MBT5896395.1 SDR family oxidoreductase [Rhodospirillaceae bacterium]MBT6426103.1 SDR family oxidoreductase [Rhodospirillaceae bacterium]MBT6608451.1 SDR family oxidoreductase [Rhodospirillaceae bacterium]
MSDKPMNVMVTGGGGYVGSCLIPKLLAAGHHVTVLDLFIYGMEVFNGVGEHPNLRCIKGDIRDPKAVAKSVENANAVIHLACISNDPSFELNPDLGKSINFDCFQPLVRAAKDAGVRRFIYASSSSVYGIKSTENVTEELALEPLTDYSKFKAMCEDVLEKEREPGFVTLTLRPATVCGYAPRLRLDLTVNILTNHAINNNKITVFGGAQKRPNINVEDMTDLYVQCLQYPDEMIDGKIFNAGYENHTVSQIAEMVRNNVGETVDIVTTPTDDNRSYHVSSEKMRRELGFTPSHSIDDAVDSLTKAFAAGKVPNAMNDARYYNVKLMQGIHLQ